MGTSRSKRNSVLDDFLAVLTIAPIWFGPVCAAGIYITLRWLVPWVLSANPADQEISKIPANVFIGLSVTLAPWLTGLAALCWFFAEVQKWFDRHRLDRQTGADSIAALSWFEFESLVSEAFRRQGYTVEQIGGRNPDGGIDQRLHRAGEVVLVQCKHWRKRKVGVTTVRELLGVVTSEKAQAGIIVTSGRFTQEAREFAAKVAIRLIAGEELLEMIRAVQFDTPRTATLQPPSNAETPSCPKCGSTMIRRTAERGPNPGSQFWGCPRYPACRGTMELNSSNVQTSES